MKKISGFDLGFIIAFVVVALLGFAAWWYLSGNLASAQAEVAAANSDFDKSSTKYDLVVSRANGKTLQANNDLLFAKLDPLIRSRLRPKDSKLLSIDKEDPVAWKHDLDDEVRRLNTAAKLHGVTVPPNFYFSFSRYLSQSPGDEQTPVLSKQLLGVEQIANILINAPVRGIQAIRRTYEEDPRPVSGSAAPLTAELDHLAGYSVVAPAEAYTAYPFEIDFETTSENFRNIVDNLIQSPYIFVIRTLNIQNSTPNSPLLNSLDTMAGPPPSSVVETSPGEVAATPPARGPQYLFGNSTIVVKARIDMVEWNAEVSEK